MPNKIFDDSLNLYKNMARGAKSTGEIELNRVINEEAAKGGYVKTIKYSLTADNKLKFKDTVGGREIKVDLDSSITGVKALFDFASSILKTANGFVRNTQFIPGDGEKPEEEPEEKPEEEPEEKPKEEE